MPIVTRRPTSPGQRGLSVNRQPHLAKQRPTKSLVRPLRRHAGRDRFGRISIRHRGGGNKRLYRVLSRLEGGPTASATIEAIEYDPNRSANIALVTYQDGSKAYVLAGHEMTDGQTLEHGPTAALKPGNRLPLRNIPRGLTVFDVALDPNRPGSMVRSAGTSATITAHEDDNRYAHLKLPSGEIRRILATCYATLGTVSNPEHSAVSLGKAGRTRHRGRRPQVLGKSMNPNDHPHGGGEGHSPIGLRFPKTPWGKPALGKRTRRSHQTNVFIVRSRHAARRKS